MPKFNYRFSIGNSNEGQVGFCFDFAFESPQRDDKAAVEAAKAMLSDYGAEESLTGLDLLPSPFSGQCIYINVAKITEEDIVMCSSAP